MSLSQLPRLTVIRSTSLTLADRSPFPPTLEGSALQPEGELDQNDRTVYDLLRLQVGDVCNYIAEWGSTDVLFEMEIELGGEHQGRTGQICEVSTLTL